MRFVAATGNAHKLAEFRRILAPLGIEVLAPSDVGIEELDVEENGDTFAENAAIKAAAFYKAAGIPTLADDSGLYVDALGGRPGVYSARYLGTAPQSEKNRALLKELEAVQCNKRTARFICNIHCMIDNYTMITVEGRCEGRIADHASGDGGFGFDPIFLVGDKTFASLTDAEKDSISHRGIALRELCKALESYLENKEKI